MLWKVTSHVPTAPRLYLGRYRKARAAVALSRDQHRHIDAVNLLCGADEDAEVGTTASEDDLSDPLNDPLSVRLDGR